MVLLRLFFLCALFLPAHHVFSQHYYFRYLSVNEQLPGSLVLRVFQDSKGYQWYITDKGIASSDGVQLKHYTARDGFNDVGAFHIAEDSNGVIWFVSRHFQLYYFKDQRFHRVACPEVAWVDIDEHGNAWVLDRYNMDIYRINAQQRLERNITFSYRIVCYSMIKTQHGFLVATTHQIWHVSESGHLRLLQKVDEFVTHIRSRFFRRRDGSTIVTTDKGIYSYDDATGVLHPVGIPLTEVFCMYEHESGDLWFGTMKGLIRLEKGNVQHPKLSYYLQEEEVLSMSYRSDHTFRFGTRNGVFACNFNAVHFTKQDGLPGEGVDNCKVKDGIVYFFSKSGMITAYINGRMKLLRGKLALQEAIKTPEGDIYVIRPSAHEYLDQGRICLLPPCSPVFYSDKDYIYGYNSVPGKGKPMGIYRLEGKGTRMVMDSLQTRIMYACCMPWCWQVIGDHYFFSKEMGFVEKWFRNGKLYSRTYRHPAHINHIQQSGDITLAATIDNGLFVYTPHGTRHYTEESSLLSDYCIRLVKRKDMIWLLTSRGIMRFKVDAYGGLTDISNFTSGNFLLNNTVNDIDFGHDSVYVATASGVSVFREDANPPRDRPQLFIEKLQVNNIDTFYHAPLTLPYTHNNISVTLGSTAFGPGRQIMFKYVINADTFYTQTSTVQFSSLSPGNYLLSFWVKGSNGLWSSRSRMIELTIVPPFWKTFGFIATIALLCCAVAGSFVAVYVRGLKRRNDYRVQMAGLELRSLRLYMNPHFIFNSLASLQSFILTSQVETANQYVSRFSRLIRSIMNYSVKGELTLAEEISLLDSYISLEQVRFREQLSYSVTWEESLKTESIVIPSLLIQPFVENAIRHGLTGYEGKGMVKVHFYRKDKLLYCTVEDNGKGRTEKNQDRHHFSSGIRFTEDRIRLLVKNKQLDVVKISDLVTGNKPSGTRVDILVPILEE